MSQKNKMKTIAFFNNKGGVGKTSLAYHVSWMLREMENVVLSVDLDPQANLTGMFMGESDFEEIVEGGRSLYSALEPLISGTGDIEPAKIFEEDNVGLLPGDLRLSSVEGEFSKAWPECLDGDNRAFRVTTAFSRLIEGAGKEMSADFAIIDMGPNLGAINRAVLIASNYVVFPLGPDLFSYQGLKNVGEFLNKWRKDWEKRKREKPEALDFDLPQGSMTPIGYVMMRHSIRYDRPVKAYKNWMDKMPGAYKKHVLKNGGAEDSLLSHLKDYRSLMPMAQESKKPIFFLKPGDGAIGSHFQAARDCGKDFKELTQKILEAIEKADSSP